MRYAQLPIASIVLPSRLHRVNPNPDALRELADSIHTHGQLQPILVRPLGEQHELVAGHRRLLAHQLLGRTIIDALIHEDPRADATDGARWAENLHREDLSPMEEATALAYHQRTHNSSNHSLARMLGRSEGWIESRLALLAMPEELQEHVHAGRLAIAAALDLARVHDPEHRAYLLTYALDGGATVAVVRDWVHAWTLHQARGTTSPAPRPALPLEGESSALQLPCWLCSAPHRHDHLQVLRLCAACVRALENQPAPASLAAGGTASP